MLACMLVVLGHIYCYLPNISIAVTMIFVNNPNIQKVICVFLSNLALMTCRNVLAPGARILSWADITENRSICIEAPAAYQKGPLIPYYKIEFGKH